MKKLILATNNIHKISEMSAILSGLDLKILSAKDFPDFPEIDETGETLTENAILKVRAVWEKYRMPALADDTGLEVDYLKGAPGVYSARFSGPGCTYDDNNRKLLLLLDGVTPAKRTARFKTVMAFIDNDGVVQHVEGVLEGEIATQPSGDYGFGYDPIFIVGKTGNTLAEFEANEKNAISHRSRALAKIRPIIERALSKAN
jgi:XTP/dITP diphosphohydrolase